MKLKPQLKQALKRLALAERTGGDDILAEKIVRRILALNS